MKHWLFYFVSSPAPLWFSMNLVIFIHFYDFISDDFNDCALFPFQSPSSAGMLTRGQWVNLAINVGSVVSDVFSSTFKSIEMISVSASCKLRKVFTMKHQPHNTNSGGYQHISSQFIMTDRHMNRQAQEFPEHTKEDKTKSHLLTSQIFQVSTVQWTMVYVHCINFSNNSGIYIPVYDGVCTLC